MRDGEAIARVTAVLKAGINQDTPRRLGFLEGGDFKVPDDFNEMGREEIEKMFYGEE